jgi:hypothetical protein
MKSLRARSFIVAFVLSLIVLGDFSVAEEWADLLHGKKLELQWTTEGNWKLDDQGVVSLQPRKGEEGWQRYGMYLWSKSEYKDFEIEFDYKVQAEGNSGFYFHVGDSKHPVEKGIEVQIFDNSSLSPKEKLNDHASGGVIPGIPPTKDAGKKAGEWNTMLVRVEGSKLLVKLNGEQVNEVALNQGKLKDRPASGIIGFQDHGMPISLRSIRIRHLK